MKVGILYICTGAYTVFWPDFFQSFQQNFLPGVEKTYYVFTDAERIDHDDDPAVRRIYQKAYDWPYSTLKRFAVFLQAEEELRSCDYLYFANANLLCTAQITPADVLPRPEKGEDLVVACHLGYWHKKPCFLPYDRNPRSRACMPYNAGQVYVAGGFNGGTAQAFLWLCHTLNDRTEADLADGVIARWHDESQLTPLSSSGRIGIGWSSAGGEAGGLLVENYLAADGIVNILRVLEELEDEKIHGLTFIELNACSGGCAGGTLTVENAYIAAAKTKRLSKYQPVSKNHLSDNPEVKDIYWADNVEYEPVFRLGNTFRESLKMMSTVEELTARFPGLDCGSCGAPTCQTLAEDIVRGDAAPNDCIYVLRSNIADLSQKIERLTSGKNTGQPLTSEEDDLLHRYIHELTTELASFGVPGKSGKTGKEEVNQ